ncbi:MAG: SUMF1/EgtB/PvdO family nonheme iron enzyme [Pseudomonadota bacterium]
MADIFISYARVDLERVRPIAEALQAHGWEVWWDLNSLRSGQSFNKAIREALSQAKSVLVLWSETSTESSWVEAEAYWAWENDKLASVVLDDGLRLPVPFNTTHVEYLCDWSGDTSTPGFRKLIADLTELMGAPGKTTGTSSIEIQQSQQPAKSASNSRAPGAVYRDPLKNGGEGPEMVIIPAGTFLMGSPEYEEDRCDDESPQHEVIISQSFALGRFPVTFEEYERYYKATTSGLARWLKKPKKDYGWGRGRRPVINLSWQDAVGYCEWLKQQTGKSYRLPSEAEWEYACRAGTRTLYWWGDDPGKNRANFEGSSSQWSGRQTSPVGSFDPAPFGLHDMHGNVWEWCQDCWHDNYNYAPRDGTAWEAEGRGECGQRVIRGGSWFNGPGFLRSATRSGRNTGNMNNNLGFRLAQDL